MKKQKNPNPKFQAQHKTSIKYCNKLTKNHKKLKTYWWVWICLHNFVSFHFHHFFPLLTLHLIFFSFAFSSHTSQNGLSRKKNFFFLWIKFTIFARFETFPRLKIYTNNFCWFQVEFFCTIEMISGQNLE